MFRMKLVQQAVLLAACLPLGVTAHADDYPS